MSWKTLLGTTVALTMYATPLQAGTSAICSSGQGVTLENGVLATFTMNSDGSECKLVLTKVLTKVIKEDYYKTERLELKDRKCDYSIDEIDMPNPMETISKKQLPNIRLNRALSYESVPAVFDKADKLYSKILKQYGLRKTVEKDLEKMKKTLEERLDKFFK